jgi:indole-3-glycerol phosphate synthase
VSRFSQAISEGDGISVIPVLEGDVGELAALAEEAGAEAIAVWRPGDVEAARSRSGLPILVRAPDLNLEEQLRFVSTAGADACVVAFGRFSGEDTMLEDLYTRVSVDDVDCVIEVRDEDELQETLERVDPEIILISERGPADDWHELERTLDLLPDIPAGKLVVSEAAVVAREQVVALERAGVDAILVGAGFLRDPDFAAALAELTGRAETA